MRWSSQELAISITSSRSRGIRASSSCRLHAYCFVLRFSYGLAGNTDHRLTDRLATFRNPFLWVTLMDFVVFISWPQTGQITRSLGVP